MTKRMTTARRATALGLAGALVLSATATAAEPRKDFQRIDPNPVPGGPTAQLQAEINNAAEVGNDYLDRSRDMHDKDKLTGGFMILSGFYGALVTAFNPAPKNLKAAILASGTATGLNTGLKFRDRGRVYVQGHRALDCVVGVGKPMLSYTNDHWPTLERLRQAAASALKAGDEALILDAQIRPPPLPEGEGLEAKFDAWMLRQEAATKDDERKMLEERMKVLAELDKSLAEEQGAYQGMGPRAGDVRRKIQAVIDERLAAVAPDYAAVVKAMGETAEPAAAPAGTAGNDGMKAYLAGVSPIPTALAKVNAAIRDIQAQGPGQARAAFKDMGECVPKAS